MVGEQDISMRYSVPAVCAVQNGQELFLFFLPAKTLNALPIQVERFDPDKRYDDPEQGYQRAAEKNRARRFARYLEAAAAVSPTAIMLNDRNRQSKYDPKTGMLIFDSDKGPVFNYDGQHRELGYRLRMDGDEAFAEFPVPVVMTRGMEKLTEMMQFRTINSTAKGVPTALVNAILAKLQATEGDEAIDASAHRNVVCYKVTELVNNDPDSPWHQLIALPNQGQWTKRDTAEDPTREHTRVIKANSFVDALRPVYDYVSMLKIAASIDERAGEIAAIINEFWSALKEKMPQAFDQANDYALFKSGGVGPMHLVLRDLMVKMHTGHRRYTRDGFLAMTEGSDLLDNAEFWRSDNEDGARIYSGKANWPDLAKRIIRDVEEGATA
jgi:DGQHR domain-containing protein